LECGRKPGGPSVAKVTAAAKSQATNLRIVVIETGYHDQRPDNPSRIVAMSVWLMKGIGRS
jgi:hypothetical protein